MLPHQPSVGNRLYAHCSALTPPQLYVTKTESKPLAIRTEPKPLMTGAEPQPLVIKREPVGDRVPSRKRSGTLSVFREIPQKKIKPDPENPSIAEVDTKPPPMSTEVIRSELTDLQAEINHLQPQLDRAKRKKSKSTEQLTREKTLTAQLIALYQRKKELTEMIPAVSAPTHPIAGPSYRSGFIDGFAQPRQPLPLVQPFITSVPVASGSNFPLNPVKDEPMDTDSDNNHAAPSHVSDADHFHSPEDDKHQMLVSSTDFGVDLYHYNTAKADEWVPFSTLVLLTR